MDGNTHTRTAPDNWPSFFPVAKSIISGEEHRANPFVEVLGEASVGQTWRAHKMSQNSSAAMGHPRGPWRPEADGKRRAQGSKDSRTSEGWISGASTVAEVCWASVRPPWSLCLGNWDMLPWCLFSGPEDCIFSQASVSKSSLVLRVCEQTGPGVMVQDELDKNDNAWQVTSIFQRLEENKVQIFSNLTGKFSF